MSLIFLKLLASSAVLFVLSVVFGLHYRNQKESRGWRLVMVVSDLAVVVGIVSIFGVIWS